MKEDIMIESIAAASVDMNAARLAVEYSMAMTEKVMDTQELAGQELIRMLPPVPSEAHYIDTYA